MVEKYFDKNIPAPTSKKTDFDASLIECANVAIQTTKDHFEKFLLQDAISATWVFVRRVNKYIDETAPWVLAKDENEKETLQTVMYHLVESLRIIAHLVAPYLVETAPKILQSIGKEKEPFDLADLKFGESYQGLQVSKQDILFKRLDVEEELKYFEEKKKKEQIKTQTNEEKKEEIAKITIDDFDKIELKVGEILECKKHPNATKLLVSQIKIGDEVRQIVSGIANFYQPEEMVGKKVVVVSNLKPANIRGVESNGMILCASIKDSLEVIELHQVENGSNVH